MSFSIEQGSDGRVHLLGRLDAAAAERAKEEFASLPGPVVADCSGLEYISSAGLAALLVLYKRLSGQGQTLRLTQLMPRVRNVFQYAGLDKLLAIE